MTTAPALTGLPTKRAALHLTRDYDWRDDAACREEDPELFFPVGLSGPALDQEDQAKAVCRRCPSRDLCLQWALETGQESGVWGGLSEWDRGGLLGQQYRTASDGTPAWKVIVETRRGEYEALAGQGLSGWEIAQRMRTNAQTIIRVRDALAGLEQAEEVKAS